MRLAALLDTAKGAEAKEAAADLRERVSRLRLAKPGPRAGRPTMLMQVEWEGCEPVKMSRADAAEMLGITPAVLSVMVSRNKGVWHTVRTDGEGRTNLVSISRYNPTKSKPAESPE